MRNTKAVLVLGLFMAVPSFWVSAQQAPDLSGKWELQASAAFTLGNQPCEYSGSMDLVQAGSELSGMGLMALTSGPVACPVNPTAALVGTVVGNSLQMVSGSGNSGDSTFTGVIGAGGRTIAGDLTVVAGPFVGLSGSWQAARPGFSVEIPTLGFAALAILTLILAASGVWLQRRRVTSRQPR